MGSSSVLLTLGVITSGLQESSHRTSVQSQINLADRDGIIVHRAKTVYGKQLGHQITYKHLKVYFVSWAHVKRPSIPTNRRRLVGKIWTNRKTV